MSREEKNEYILIWRIKNYSACYQTKRECIESPGFSVESLSGVLWYLCFYPKGKSNLEKNVSCYLTRKKSSELIATQPIDISIEIVIGKNIVLECKNSKYEFSEKRLDWGWKNFMDISELMREIDLWEEDVLTLRCKIKCDKLSKQTVWKTEACTVIDVDRRSFEWNVTAPILMEYSESITFSLSDVYVFEFAITTMLESLKIVVNLKEHIEISTLPIMFRMTFCDKEGSKIVFKHAKHIFEDTKEWAFPDFVSKNALEACSLHSNNYEFRLKCEIYASNERILYSSIENVHYNPTLPSLVAESIEVPDTDMQNHFQSLFINKTYSDVIVRAGNEEFKSHKLVLRVRSPVFKAMLDQGILEKETGIVDVTDVDGKTMRSFLEYLYTETVDTMDYESAKKLLLAADKYKVPSLVEVCVSLLRSVLTDENACEIITIADSINCVRLMSDAFDFITLHSSKILNTPNWRQCIKENVELATDILAKLSAEFIPKYK